MAINRKEKLRAFRLVSVRFPTGKRSCESLQDNLRKQAFAQAYSEPELEISREDFHSSRGARSAVQIV